MGGVVGSNSKDEKSKEKRKPRRSEHDLEYYKMLQAREKRDQARYKEISNAKGTALHNLKQRETMAKSE
jgi:hypothetical protein